LLGRRAGGQLGDLRQTIDDLGRRLAELRLDVGKRDVRVLDDVVQEPGGHRDRIEAELGEDLRDLDGVRDVRIARVAHLPAAISLNRYARTSVPRSSFSCSGSSLSRHPGICSSSGAVFAAALVAVTGSPRSSLHAPSIITSARTVHHNSPASAKLVYRPRPMI